MGRKRAIPVVIEQNNIIHEEITPLDDTVPAPVLVAQTASKRRGKKQFPVVAKISCDGIIGSLMTQEIRPLIAHLPIHSSEIKFYDGPPKYDPNPPIQMEAYYDMLPAVEIENGMPTADQSHYSFIDLSAPSPPNILPYEERELPLLNPLQVHNTTAETAVVPPTTVRDTVPQINIVADKSNILMLPFINMKDARRLPDETDIACFWCTHEFNWTPAVIPQFEEKGLWHVYGNFCCPQCALAYLLEEKEGLHTRWERIALLHRLYSKNNLRIYPAPSREIMKRFGGQHTIEEYRSIINKGQVRIDINHPPMISLIGSIDTKPIDFYETTAKGAHVILNTDMINRAEEGLRLKRTKPLKERESTLDSCMNILVRAR